MSKCKYEIEKHMKAYCIGKSIILPHVRYLDNGKRSGMMFHSYFINSYGLCHTLGCDKRDFSGLCLGHRMSRKEFLDSYCGGLEPKTSLTQNDKEV